MRINKAIIIQIIFIGLYSCYIYRQYFDLFFEAQFLHIGFIQDIVEKRYSLNNFFTTFAEHLLPGYNIILALNFSIFKIWGGFDFLVTILSYSFLALYLGNVISKDCSLSSKNKLLSIFVCSLIILSPTNNPASGMALAAIFGVSVFAIILNRVAVELNELDPSIIVTGILIFLTIIFFLGGYSIGAICSLGATITLNFFKTNKIKRYSVKLTSVIALSAITYLIITSIFGNILVNRPTSQSFGFISFFSYLITMAGSSLLGKAFYESNTSFLFLYYFYGIIILIFSSSIFFKLIKGKLEKNDYLFSGLYLYSIINLLIVSLFRHSNGYENAMGQWYNAHSHFLPLFLCLYLIKYKHKFLLSKITSSILIILIILGGLIGYYYDWKKSPYVPSWKEQFLFQVPRVLNNYVDKDQANNAFNTMLWNYEGAHKGLNLFYKNRLWIFQSQSPLIFGVGKNGDLRPGLEFSIICPYGASNLSFIVDYINYKNRPFPIYYFARGQEVREILISSQIEIVNINLFEIDGAFIYFLPKDVPSSELKFFDISCDNIR
jgi:hypothetical protein